MDLKYSLSQTMLRADRLAYTLFTPILAITFPLKSSFPKSNFWKKAVH